MAGPRIAFIGAGSTVFMKNLIGDCLLHSALESAHISLMDIDQDRLDESALVARKLIRSLDRPATVSTHLNQREAISGADFIIVAFQIGGYEPCTVTDFEIPKKFSLRQTIADTLGIGGIMRGLRTVPHLWKLCEDIIELCPDAIMLQYVNPMAINTWAISEKFPQVKQVGLCHSVQGTIEELAIDLNIPSDRIRYKCAGINHVAFYTELLEKLDDGGYRDLYPKLMDGYNAGKLPNPLSANPRCPNLVRYEIMKRFGYFVTESSEHFAEYVPWFIKGDRPDLIDKFQIPLDEYPTRCIEQVEEWKTQADVLKSSEKIEVRPSKEYASSIINSVWTGNPSLIYGNFSNNGYITNLPPGCAVEIATLVDANGLQPQHFGKLPPHLAGLMQTQINVQQMVVEALITENKDHIYHAAALDPHTAAELDLDQIWEMTDMLIKEHGNWLPDWCHS